MTPRLVRLALVFLLATGLTAPGTSPTASAAEKTETWLEVRTPHFTVVTNGSEKQARRVANQFEQIRAAFQKMLVKDRKSTRLNSSHIQKSRMPSSA